MVAAFMRLRPEDVRSERAERLACTRKVVVRRRVHDGNKKIRKSETSEISVTVCTARWGEPVQYVGLNVCVCVCGTFVYQCRT